MTCQSKSPICLLKSILIETGTFLFGFIVLIALVILFVISAPLFLFRVVIIKVAKIFRPDLKSTVSPQGNLFTTDLFSSKSPRCSLVVPMVLEGHFPLSEFYRRWTLVISTADKKTGRTLYPEYKQYVEMFCGFAFWRNDPNFDITNHVKLYNFGGRKEIDGKVSHQEVREIVEELLNKRFEPCKSPWEVDVVQNYHDPHLPEKGAKTVMIVRLHHTLADGYSILNSLIQGLTHTTMASLSLPTPTRIRRDKWEKIWFNATILFRLMYDVGDYFGKAIRENPFKVPDSKKSWNQIYGNMAKPVPIQKIKDIKEGLGVTFTSVLLSAIAASLSRITRAKAANNKEQVGDRMAFFLPLPIPGDHPDALINYVTGAQIDLTMENYSDPTLRVYDCNRQLANQKASTIPWLLQFLGRNIGLHMSSVCALLTANPVNISGLSNFPTGPNGIYIRYGDVGKILSMELAAGALTGISGLAFMAMSYEKSVRFSVTGESSVLTKRDVDGLLTLIHEEIDLLHEIVTQKSNM